MVGLRANPCLAAINDVMVEYGVPYEIERGGKHPRIVIECNGRKKRIGFSGSPSDTFGPKKAAAETRRELRALFPEKFVEGSERVSAVATEFVTLDESQIVFSTSDLAFFDDEPRILDLDLGRRLGLSRPDNIRGAIRANAKELSLYNNVLCRTQKTSESGGRPGEAFYLTEPQALLITMRSNAPLAPFVRKALIDLYTQWRTQQVAASMPALPAPPRPEEVIANREAIDLLVRETTASVLDAIKPLLSQQMHWGNRRAERIEDSLDRARAQIIAVAAKGVRAAPEPIVIASPQRASILDAYSLSGLTLPVPQQSKLGQTLRLSMDEFFIGSNVITLKQPDAIGIMRRTYPYADFRRWYDAKGKALIERHMSCMNAKAVVSKTNHGEQCRLSL